MEEVIDKSSQNFHHSLLAPTDDELSIISSISAIMPYVFVSSWDTSLDPNELLSKNIKIILNVSEQKHLEKTISFYTKNCITYSHISIENLPTANLKNASITTYTIIKTAIDQKRNILIVDHQGLSTSLAIVSYFLLKSLYISNRPSKPMLPSILEKVKSKRGIMDINIGFIEQLEDIESELSGDKLDDNKSLSSRRNIRLKNTINTNIANEVKAQIEQAEKMYKVQQIKRI